MWLQAVIKSRLPRALSLPRRSPFHSRSPLCSPALARQPKVRVPRQFSPVLLDARRLTDLVIPCHSTGEIRRDGYTHDFADLPYNQATPSPVVSEPPPPASNMVYNHTTPYVTPHILHKNYAQAFDAEQANTRTYLPLTPSIRARC